MANIYKDEAGHFTSKENDGGPCKHKRINGGKYEYSEDEGKSWKQFNNRKEYDEYEAESAGFDETVDDDFGFDEEPDADTEKYYSDKIMSDIAEAHDKKGFEYIADNIDELTESGLITDEMSDKLYAELDKKIDESGEKMPLYNSKISGEDHDELEDKEKPEEYIQYSDGVIKGPNGLLNEEEWKSVDKSKVRKATEKEDDEYLKKNFDRKGLVKDTLVDKFNDAHLYNDGGKYQLALSDGSTKEFNSKNEAIDFLSDYSKKDYSWAKDKSDDLEWRFKPENLAVVQSLQKMGIDTGSMSEEEFNTVREIFNRYVKTGKNEDSEPDGRLEDQVIRELKKDGKSEKEIEEILKDRATLDNYARQYEYAGRIKVNKSKGPHRMADVASREDE